MTTLLTKSLVALAAILSGLLVVIPCLLWDLLSGSLRFWRILVGIDCAASATFGGSGKNTISLRAGLAARKGKRWGCLLCRLLDKAQPGHCESAIAAEQPSQTEINARK
jgi:hypothetical protein